MLERLLHILRCINKMKRMKNMQGKESSMTLSTFFLKCFKHIKGLLKHGEFS
jgi:hypothetical protein